jgi:hypothetical protein
MTPRHYHSPAPTSSARTRCPVCREAVYSPAGIHPQCAVRQAESPRPEAKPAVAPAGVPGEAIRAAALV